MDNGSEPFSSRPRVAARPQQIESQFKFLILNWTRRTLFDGMILMRVRKYWLDYDAAALAFLIIGIAAIELFALIIM